MSKSVCLHFEAPSLSRSEVVRVARIELASQPWEGRILPLNHTRLSFEALA